MFNSDELSTIYAALLEWRNKAIKNTRHEDHKSNNEIQKVTDILHKTSDLLLESAS